MKNKKKHDRSRKKTKKQNKRRKLDNNSFLATYSSIIDHINDKGTWVKQPNSGVCDMAVKEEIQTLTEYKSITVGV